ncbi:MAG: hypothetical protein FK731_14905 [Asgard group archaeon]|nr:hypothetical protein [Asgard group archaeon]
MISSFEELAEELKPSTNKLVFLSGFFDEFAIHNFSMDYNFHYLDFEQFLIENKIDSKHFKVSDANRSTSTSISIDKWTQEVAYKDQKHTVVIDGFSLERLPDLLTKNLLMQELLYLSRNTHRLKTNIVFAIYTQHGPLEEQILPKILQNSLVVKL